MADSSGAIRMLNAVAELERALANNDPTTDELLRRLRPGQSIVLKVRPVDDGQSCYAVAQDGPFSAMRDGRGWPLDGHSADPATALRAALLQLPAPTEPPPEEG